MAVTTTRRISTPLLLVLSLVLAGCRASGVPSAHSSKIPGPLCAVYFSPHGGCTQEIVQAIWQAKVSVLVQAYAFTSTPIAEALVAAYRRGVQVEVILDKSQVNDRRSAASILVRGGVPVEIDGAHAIAHNKVMVIDSQTVLTGSFNFTTSAEDRNAENLLAIQDRNLAIQYAENWRAHQAHSKPYRLRGP